MKYSYEKMYSSIQQVKSIAGLCRILGLQPVGGNYRTMHKYINHYDLDTSHFTGELWSKGLSLKENTNDYSSSTSVKKKFLTQVSYNCSHCDISNLYNGKNLVLHLDHIDGNSFNNDVSNLRLLCPNCHSQTETYCARNKRSRLPISPKVKLIKVRLSKKLDKFCIDCYQQINYKAQRCKSCAATLKVKRKFEVSKEELEKLISEVPMTKIGEMFGVSDNAVRKRAKKLGIVLENRLGYWGFRKLNEKS